ncbi:hypothetical protein JTE90_011482 [Oedothorax gibbosus]|uniref:Maturase K n=1 Tax=Oedothorax gibbosus TaxID=931172 RepID=A0AAV6VB81_9ARAC|nr:hypothetical protein JTE90_011482 [Oedothorax gibbosus]
MDSIQSLPRPNKSELSINYVGNLCVGPCEGVGKPENFLLHSFVAIIGPKSKKLRHDDGVAEPRTVLYPLHYPIHRKIRHFVLPFPKERFLRDNVSRRDSFLELGCSDFLHGSVQ